MASYQGKTIYLDTAELRHLLRLCQPMMTKSNRIIHGTPLLAETAQVLRHFVKAHEFSRMRLHDRADEAFWEMVGDFEVLKVDIRDMVNDGALSSPHPDKTKALRPDIMAIALLERVASIDEGITKWRNSLYKGKSGTDE